MELCASALLNGSQQIKPRFRKENKLKRECLQELREQKISTLTAMNNCRDEYIQLLKEEDAFWRQRAKHDWTKFGDLYTFFPFYCERST